MAIHSFKNRYEKHSPSGLSALRSLAIFFIILDIAFSCVFKLLKGGFICVFRPDNDWEKTSNRAPNDWSLLYAEIHVPKSVEWCRESDIPSTSRWRCFCNTSRRAWGVDQQLRSWHVCLLALTIVALDAVKHFIPQVLEGFVSIIRVSFPVILDKLSYFAFC